VVDQFGFPCAQTNSLDESDWDERHQLNGSENELKPKLMRDYFSKPLTMRELKAELKYNPKLHNTASVLRNLTEPEVSERQEDSKEHPGPLMASQRHSRSHLEKMRSPESLIRQKVIAPDSGPPLVPTRHVFGGNMKDRDGMERMWNDRWPKGIGELNEHLHPDHRAYFTQRSLFEKSKSQRWRRYLDQQVAVGATLTAEEKWKPVGCKKRERFPPLGAPLRGRSGTPIPGATE
jgi:hypothetical protein